MLYDKSVKENDCWESSRSNTLELRNLLRHCGNQPINASQPPIVGLFIEMWEGRVSKASAARPGWVVPLGMINESINSQEFDKTRLNYPVVACETQTHFLVVAALHPGGEKEQPESEIRECNILHNYIEVITKIQKKEREERVETLHDYIYTRDSLLVYHDYIITWDIQLKIALTFKTIIIEGNELSGGIPLTLWSVFGI